MNKSITVSELKASLSRGENVQLVDVRSAGEYAAGHVPQAINIPLEQVEARLGDFAGSQVAILCQSGARAGMACEILRSHHDELLLVEGGTSAWMNAGLPIVQSSSSAWSLERQVRAIAGILVLIGTVLSIAVAPGWVFLAMFVGLGLAFAGITNICGMALLLAKLPWNRPNSNSVKPQGCEVRS